jgi:Uma2 family endonuclease
MTITLTEQERVTEETVKWIWPRPVTFDEFLELFDKNYDVELVNGTVVERMSAQLEHEKLYAWLLTLLNQYVEDRNLGIVLGSRMAVQINRFSGRLPDLLFVRRERMDILHAKAVYGPPDLVIEIISPNDRPSDVIALETDYRSIGVQEMVFIDPKKRRVRLLHKQADDYTEQSLTTGRFASEAVAGFQLEVEWLFAEPRPAVREVLTRLLEARQTPDRERREGPG